MPLSKDEWKELREKIASEPEGSPARVVLAEYDHVWGAWRKERATELIACFRREDHLTTEEATRLIDACEDGAPLRMERGPCRACGGVGRVPRHGVIGGVLERCTACDGKKTVLRVQLPWDPYGEPLTFAGDPVST